MAKEYAGMKQGLPPGERLTWDQICDSHGTSLRKLRCPAGGNYTPGPLGEDPKCSIQAHQLPYFYQFEEFKMRTADQKRFCH